ncbi:MAG: FRG domain-containing protein [Cyclobacteriaceae bacterium]
MKTFKDIESPVKETFQKFIDDLIRPAEQPLKYYYWSLEFFENVGGLSFEYFPLTIAQKKIINQLGKDFFDRTDVYFEINENSHRHDLYVHNFNKLFEGLPDKKDYRQADHFEYLKEYVLWKLLKETQSKATKEENAFFSKIVEVQRKNFLRTYLIYRLEHTKSPGLKEYTKFIRTQQGEELEEKLKELDLKGYEDDNQPLRDKVEQLYILKSHESKIHFVFSREGGDDKEELRELLDVMGRPETGKLYRGQAESAWKLDSSLTREPKYLDTEAELYYEILSLKPDAFANDHTVYERLITMQHFGMPTRLMDVTRNPLVAIFFACNNMQRASSDGIVYTFKRENKEILNFEDPKLKDLQCLFENGKNTKKADDFLSGIWFIKGVAKNQRISNQSGDFIFVGNGDDIKQKLYDLPALTIIIDSSTKEVLIQQLESLNIHGGAVYPDLTNLSNYIKNKYLADASKRSVVIKVPPTSLKIGAIKPKVVAKKKASGKPKEPEKLVGTFDENKFWESEKRRDMLEDFATKENLKEDKLRNVISDFLYSEKEPLDPDIHIAMNQRPGLKILKKTTAQLKDKILKFTKALQKAE